MENRINIERPGTFVRAIISKSGYKLGEVTIEHGTMRAHFFPAESFIGVCLNCVELEAIAAEVRRHDVDGRKEIAAARL